MPGGFPVPGRAGICTAESTTKIRAVKDPAGTVMACIPAPCAVTVAGLVSPVSSGPIAPMPTGTVCPDSMTLAAGNSRNADDRDVASRTLPSSATVYVAAVVLTLKNMSVSVASADNDPSAARVTEVIAVARVEPGGIALVSSLYVHVSPTATGKSGEVGTLADAVAAGKVFPPFRGAPVSEAGAASPAPHAARLTTTGVSRRVRRVTRAQVDLTRLGDPSA